MSIKDLDSKFIANTYDRYNVELISGKGSLLKDSNGKEFIDMGSGIGVNLFGAADDEWRNAVINQLSKIQHTSNLYYNEPCAQLAKMLSERSGLSKTFFSNSGAEANECMFKVARKFAAETKSPDYFTIVTLKNSFHGRTLTALAATGQDHYHELYQPLTPGFVHVSTTDFSELEKIEANNKIAAVIIECIQGEGGVIPLDKDYAAKLQNFVKEKNILLGIDEVQTGNGRTGKLFAYMNYGLEPDIVSTAKGLGGGLPIGATLLSEKVKDVFSHGDNGSTFGGNPVVCAGACNILSRITDELLEQVRSNGKVISGFFRGQKNIEEVTGMGLMLGLKPKKPAKEVVLECIKNGVLCLTAKDRIRLLPPINTPLNLLEKAAHIIADAC